MPRASISVPGMPSQHQEEFSQQAPSLHWVCSLVHGPPSKLWPSIVTVESFAAADASASAKMVLTRRAIAEDLRETENP